MMICGFCGQQGETALDIQHTEKCLPTYRWTRKIPDNFITKAEKACDDAWERNR